MSEIKLFEGAEIVTRDGRNGVVTQHCDFLNYPWRIETYSIHPYYCDDNGNYLREWPEHTLDVVQILNPEDSPDFKKNNGWLPIETAPKNKIIMLGYFNGLDYWKWTRGRWVTQEEIEENWDCPEDGEEGWHEVSLEADEPPNCWPIYPTYWKPSPTPPEK